MNMWTKALTVGVTGSLGLSVSAQTTFITDDFEVDSSANYTILDDGNAPSGDGVADSTSAFAFDYVAAGIPLAPNSTAGDVGGLRFTANDTSGDGGAASTAEEDHITAFHNTAVTSPTFTLTVDVYMGVESGSGSTEYGHIGVASDASDFNSIFTPIAGPGHYLAFTGEGGSASDWRHSTPSTPAVPTGDATYLDPANTTNGTGALYQSLFPNAKPNVLAGSPGNEWMTVEIVSDSVNLTYSINGTPIIRTPVELTDGNLASLGYADVFDSVGPHFVVYDNLTVTDVPEPATAALLGLGGLAMLRRRSA
ncbi:MAG: PEP-CTERM sorting domain-containing protein [Planctomycetota bacterium]